MPKGAIYQESMDDTIKWVSKIDDRHAKELLIRKEVDMQQNREG